MKHIDEIGVLLSRLMDMMEQQFGSNCEIVLHDNSRDYDSTIVDIRNGHVTGRKVGGTGSNLGLEVMRGMSDEGDRYNYITYANNGKILRSSSVYFRDDDNRLIGSLCVNLDITESVRMESFIKEYNNYSAIQESSETLNEIFVSDVQQLLEELIKRGLQMAGKPASAMNREEKMALIRYLDEHGAFIIAKSSTVVGDILGISKYTFYNYLEAVRSGGEGGGTA